MKLKCVAKISSVYWQSNEESVESDKHQRIPVLESRETVVPKSRFLDKSLEENQKAATKSSTSYNSSSNNTWHACLISVLILALFNLCQS